jgi:hypothetical protein
MCASADDRVCTACAICGKQMFRRKENGYIVHKANGVRVKEMNVTESKIKILK